MKLSLFDYYLPPEFIAQYPVGKRADSRMLVLKRESGEIIDSLFSQLPDFIDSSYFLVLNNSKVFKARLFGRRATGGKVEIFLVRRAGENEWLALLRPSRRIKKDERLFFDAGHYITVLDQPGPVERLVSFPTRRDEDFIIPRYGKVPLPPYIRRSPERKDITRYQTIYARKTGSVAAPTAGLHFDRRMMARLSEKEIESERITLHIGPGTFKPVKVDDIEGHIVDPEYAEISKKTAAAINRRKAGGQKLLAVGTTAVRTIESASDKNGNLPAGFKGMVDLFIYPPYGFKMVDAMLTNFHLPKSSLLMLTAAFCGRDLILEAYRRAIDRKYRFYSYGDCMLIL